MAIYLSHQDVRDLTHYAHFIPVSKGLTQQYMARTLPGVPFNVRSFHHPVLVHTPHSSRHIPRFVRRDLLVSDDELAALLDMLTDNGVTEFVQRALAGDHRVNWVTATMSRLVLDVARLDWDPKEAIGMGAVYTRQPDGRPLRDLPDDDLWWLQLQHRAYTGALEQYVGTLIDYSGEATVLDVHSYGTTPGPHASDTAPRPEVCFGSDALHTPDWLRTAATDAFRGFEVQFDTAFTGTYLPGRQWIDDPSVSSISVKVRQDVLATPSGTGRAAAALRSLVNTCRRHASDARR